MSIRFGSLSTIWGTEESNTPIPETREPLDKVLSLSTSQGTRFALVLPARIPVESPEKGARTVVNFPFIIDDISYIVPLKHREDEYELGTRFLYRELKSMLQNYKGLKWRDTYLSLKEQLGDMTEDEFVKKYPKREQFFRDAYRIYHKRKRERRGERYQVPGSEDPESPQGIALYEYFTKEVSWISDSSTLNLTEELKKILEPQWDQKVTRVLYTKYVPASELFVREIVSRLQGSGAAGEIENLNTVERKMLIQNFLSDERRANMFADELLDRIKFAERLSVPVKDTMFTRLSLCCNGGTLLKVLSQYSKQKCRGGK